ncbi:asparagine synthetase B, partial [bacterium]|nr:asparagine synthetase B [bacterium]
MLNGFLGQTTGYHERFLKRSVIQLAKVEGTDEVKYIHGKRGQGTFTFLGG